MARKRSRAATKGMRPKKVITGAQRKARKINIEVARRAKAKSRGYDKRVGVKTKSEKRVYKKEFKKAYGEKRYAGKPKGERVAAAHKRALKQATMRKRFMTGFGAGVTKVTYRVPSGEYKPRRRRS